MKTSKKKVNTWTISEKLMLKNWPVVRLHTGGLALSGPALIVTGIIFGIDPLIPIGLFAFLFGLFKAIEDKID